MALQAGLVNPVSLQRLMRGPLLRHVEGFCDWLLEQQFGRRTVEKYLTHVSYLQEYLAERQEEEMDTVRAEVIDGFLDAYPSRCPLRWRNPVHLTMLRSSIRRFVSYLRERGRFYEPIFHPLYEPLLNDYLEWLRRYRQVSVRTVEIHTKSLCRFLEWLEEDATGEGVSALTADRVQRFFLPYAQEYPGNRGHMATALRSFLRFCVHQGYLSEFPETAVPTIRTYRLSTVPHGFTESQAHSLLGGISQHTAAGRRNYTICLMFHTYGARCGQVCALRLQDIDWEHDRILFKTTKHGKDSLLPLADEVGEHLLSYLKNDRPQGTGRNEVFLTCRAPYRPLSASTICSMVNHYARDAGITRPFKGTHAFRHGFAARMLQQGHSIKSVADVLGHRDLETTFIYTKVDFNALRQVALPWPEEERQ
jgi:site-specific recombinase XerD